MQELTSLYVIRKDNKFKDLFEVDSHMRDENMPVNKTIVHGTSLSK
jgi:hypothetical protein